MRGNHSTRLTVKRGVGLLEIVICVVLMAIGILPILQAQRASSEAVRFSRDEVTAGTLATQLVERFKLESFAFLKNANLTELIPEDPILSPWVDSEVEVPPGPIDGYRRICEKFERKATFKELSSIGRGILDCSVHWIDKREGRQNKRTFRCAIIVTRQRFPWGAY